MRINKYLASLGVASRRSVDQMIEEGRGVSINSQIAKLGEQIDPQKDLVTVNGEVIGSREEQKVYIALNKPIGYTSTAAKIKGEKNVVELVRSKTRLYPVGRLDKDSSGLMILTNDGELAQKLTHPKFHIPKTYEVLILGNVSQTQLEMLSKGITLEDGKTAPANIKVKRKSLPNNTLLEMTLYQGKKRQIRRMTAVLHLHVIDLKRISIGQVNIGNLKVGAYRNLTTEEVSDLKSVKS